MEKTPLPGDRPSSDKPAIKARKFKRILKQHTRDVFSVAFSPDGTMIATGSKDKTARVTLIETGELPKDHPAAGGEALEAPHDLPW